MRRLGRWTLNGLTVLSLLLCVGTITLHFSNAWHFGSWEVWTAGGYVQAVSFLPATDPRANGPDYRHGIEDLAEVSGGRIPAPLVARFGMPGSYERNIYVRSWILLLVGVLPFARVVRWMGRRFQTARCKSIAGDMCPKCHYDLTANVSGVCPECGTSVAKVG